MRLRTFVLALVGLGIGACGTSGEEQEPTESTAAELAAPISIAAGLDGKMLKEPCAVNIDNVRCSLLPLNSLCPNQFGVANPLTGVHTTDQSVTLGGVAGRNYSITLHVQGEVEAKEYTGSIDANSTARWPTANGFATGGTPKTNNPYAVYLLRVTNLDGTGQDYYLNSLAPPGVSDHATYGVDYLATIKAKGGATVRLVAAKNNCVLIKNCGPTPSQTLCLAPNLPGNIEPTLVTKNPTFRFNSPFDGQWLGLTVKSVTTP